jgi:hypothetical protein
MTSKLVWHLRDGSPISEDIDDSRFDALERTRRRVIAALDIEENYNGLLDRYIEFQQAIVRIALDMTVHHGGWVEFRRASQRANREVIYLLTAARLYLDQTDHTRSTHFDVELSEFNAWRNQEYDKRLGYRVCETLRNASQHRMLPAQGITVGGKWRDDWTLRDHDLRLNLIPQIIREEDPEFKRKVLDELDPLVSKEGQIELAPLLRAYMNGLSAIHSKLRKALTPTIDASIVELETVLGAKHDAWRCHVQSIHTNQRLISFPIFSEIIEHLKNLRLSNPAHDRAFDYEVRC